MTTRSLKFMVIMLSEEQITANRLRRKVQRARQRNLDFVLQRSTELTQGDEVVAELHQLAVSGEQRARARRRLAARHALLAYAFMRGVPYGNVEQKTYTSPNWGAIENIVVAHSFEDKRVVLQKLAAWKDAGPEPVARQKRSPRPRASNLAA